MWDKFLQLIGRTPLPPLVPTPEMDAMERRMKEVEARNEATAHRLEIEYQNFTRTPKHDHQ